MTAPAATSAMLREIGEIPEAASRLLADMDLFAGVVKRIEQFQPHLVVFCGRGSSGHAGVYLRYLFETRLGLFASAAAPSVVTTYRQSLKLSGVLFIVISQSGQSPDLIEATQAAHSAGALTLAIVNDADSFVANASELVLPIRAGLERSVAATKTVFLSMVAGAQLVAALARDRNLARGLQELPLRSSRALECDWSIWADSIRGGTAAFVIGRGYGLGCVREIALKVAEVLRVPAIGHSAAEVRHGPLASISATTPVLILRQNDETAAAIDDLLGDLNKAGRTIFIAGGAAGRLPWLGDRHPVCDPVVMLIPAYRAIEAAARGCGFDPDNPPHLSKVTLTV